MTDTLSCYEKAVPLLRQAVDGDGLGVVFTNTFQRDCHEKRIRYQYVFRLAAWGMVLVEAFQKPYWTYHHRGWNDTDRFPMSDLSYMSEEINIALFAVVMFFLGLALFLEAGFELIVYLPIESGNDGSCKKYAWSFMNSPERMDARWSLYIYIVVFILKLVELIIRSCALLIPSVKYSILGSSLSTFSPLGCIFVLLIEKHFHGMIRITFATLLRFITLMKLLALALLFYSVLALQLFDPASKTSHRYFSSLQDGLWTLLTVMNAADWPDPLVSAYQESQLYFIFFFSFVLVCSFGMLNIASALVFAHFRKQQQASRHRVVELAVRNINAAYRIISDANSSSTGSGQAAGIPGVCFRKLLHVYSSRIGDIRGLRRPRHKNDYDFNSDVNLLLAVLECSYNRAHGISSLSADTTPSDFVSEDWRDLYDVPVYMPVISLVKMLCSGALPVTPNGLGRLIRNKSTLQSVVPSVENQDCIIPLAMFQQFFLTIVFKADTHLVDLACLSKYDNEIAEPAISESDRETQSCTSYPIYFNEEWRQCWLATRYLSMESKFPSACVLKWASLWPEWSRQCLVAHNLVISKRFNFVTDLIFFFFMICFLFYPGKVFMLCITAFALLETAVRLVCRGWRSMIKSYGSTLDIFVAIGMVSSVFVYYVTGRYLHDSSFRELLQHESRYGSAETDDESNSAFKRCYEIVLFQCMLVLRALVLPRNVMSLNAMRLRKRRLKIAVRYCILGAADVLFTTLLLLIIGVGFAIVGMKLFGGLVQSEGTTTYPSISQSSYGKNDYYPLNFNDFFSSMGTLYTLLLVSNMHIIADGLISCGDPALVKIFVSAWYSCGVILFLNLLTASLLTSVISFWVTRKSQDMSVYDESILSENVNPLGGSLSVESKICDQGQLNTGEYQDGVSDWLHRSSLLWEGESIRAVSELQFSGVQKRRANSCRLTAHGNNDGYMRDATMMTAAPGLCPSVHESSGDESADRKRVPSAIDSSVQQHDDSSWCSRTETHVDGEDESKITVVMSAAALLHAARRGRGRHEFFTTTAHSCFQIRHRFAGAFQSAAWGLLILSFISKPVWIVDDPPADYDNRNIYPMANFTLLSARASADFALICIVVITIGLVLEVKYMSERLTKESTAGDANDFHTLSRYRAFELCSQTLSFLSSNQYFHNISTKRVVRVLLIIINIIECISVIYSFGNGSVSRISQLSRPSAWLSVVYIIWFDYESASNLRVLMQALPRYGLSLLFLMVLVVVASTVGYVVCEFDEYKVDREQTHFFDTYYHTTWNVFVSITTAGLPNQIIPYYSVNRSSFIYFFGYLSAGSVLMLNLVLAIVMAEYEHGMQTINSRKQSNRENNIKLAFSTMDVVGRGYLSCNQVRDLLHELYFYYPEFRQVYYKIPSDDEIAVLAAGLDVRSNGRIYEEQFKWILHLTQILVEERVQGHYLERFPRVFQSAEFKILFNIASSPAYNATVDGVLCFLGGLCLCINPSIYSANAETDWIKAIMAVIMVSDIAFLLVLLGPTRLISRPWGWFNICIAVVMFLWVMLIYVDNPAQLQGGVAKPYKTAHLWTSIISLIRILLVIRNIDYLYPSSNFSFAIRTTTRISKSLGALVVTFVCIMHVFALVGVSLFGGLVNRDENRSQYEALQDTDYGKNNYYDLNFNTVPSAYVTLTSLLHVSGWDVVSEGMTSVTQLHMRIFFVLWYFIGVLLFMQTVTSIFISGYVAELESQTSNDESSRSMAWQPHQSNDASMEDVDKQGTSTAYRDDQYSSSRFSLPDRISLFMETLVKSSDDSSHQSLSQSVSSPATKSKLYVISAYDTSRGHFTTQEVSDAIRARERLLARISRGQHIVSVDSGSNDSVISQIHDRSTYSSGTFDSVLSTMGNSDDL